jgi:RNA polymerase primary sigma factor
MLQADIETVALDAMTKENDGCDVSLGSLIEDEDAVSPLDAAVENELRREVRRALLTLAARQARVIQLRFGIGMPSDQTLEEVGQQFGVTRERIRQIEAKVLKRLRQSGQYKHFRSFLV